ncbi:MAG TPA: ABC transporter substrate-binding protein [Candidatus Binatia bacterium]|nr:ABC transporter substrate-binding protein [Candidatus Binatia bacterium]
MTKKIILLTLCSLLLAPCSAVEAQQPTKIPRIGIVTGISTDPSSRIKIFRQELQDLGYFEGKNILFEYRDNEGDRSRVPGIVADLVRLKVDVLFSTQAIVIREAKQATKTIPIVMAITPDPVASGLVDSLARPGGNITGFTSATRELSGKRLELLTAMIPRLSRVGILSGFGAFKDYEDAARSLKVPLQILEVRAPTADLPRLFQVAVKERLSAIITTSVPSLSVHRKQIADLALQNGLPLMSESVTVVEAGGLASYDAHRDEIYRRAAFYVDKILKGAKPADLPVEQASKFELAINLKTAKEIRLMIPPHVLARADRVIK